MRIKLLISYDGTDYAGWQRQSEEALDRRPTLQGTLEAALNKIFNQHINAQSSGRTDAGVHAEAQIVHFDAPRDPRGTPLVRSLNALTPESMSILQAWTAPKEFDALRSATHKTYRYTIQNSASADPLSVRYCHWMAYPLDINTLNALTEPLLGEHDFKSFQTGGTEIRSTIRRILEARWEKTAPDRIEFTITGTGFLKQMVRNIVGTVLFLHQNKGTPIDMKTILESRDRRAAKSTAVAKGLVLQRVYYPSDLDKLCLEL